MHIDPAVLATSLDAFATATTPDDLPPVEAGLAAVIDATRTIFGATGAGLMLTDADGSLRYVGATDGPARALEAAQEELATGPCVACFVTGHMVTTDDLAADDRWPELSPRVVPEGVGSVLGVPTRLGGVTVGSLNVFRPEPYAWDASDMAAAQAHNEVLEGMLASAVVSRHTDVVVRQLQGALDRRVVIDRAIGMLMERHAIGDVVAFAALRRAARDERRAVADLAARTLEGEDVVGARLPRPDPA